MRIPRRRFLHLTTGAVALPAVSRIAWAQTYPTRPVRIVVGFAPGGGTDIMARLIGQWLSERVGQQFLIENRPGAGTTITTESVVRAPADGYTLLMVGAPAAINATLYGKLNYNFIRDIALIASISREPVRRRLPPRRDRGLPPAHLQAACVLAARRARRSTRPLRSARCDLALSDPSP